ncbi:discoidin domain-containing protein [Pseudarthrobacter sp. J75]|uniref:discoidin domain-containing protein n=1 Tax=unclassified Pseudarthrobacter TaxID=2647000 RepID=UPI002E81D3C3|nr:MULTISPECIES: discoidin domain-containing protein [unclassified Pseudarthrobacter]MEE2524206.1 discoidin domain-containing protein [Pseudarthrobacter sp. J47]MEE2530244.1 discoidin domain-containing protein [Pseudarthrobacter sp. J75]
MAVDTAAKSATLEVPAASVVTFVVDGVSGVAADAAPVQDGHTYHLTGDASGKYLTARADGTSSIQDLGTTTAEVTPQLWTFNAVSGDEFAHDRRWVVTNTDGRVLTGSGGVPSASTSGQAALKAMSLDEARATPSAQWILSTENGKQWSLVNAGAAIALQVTGNQTAAGTAISLAASAGTTATATGNTSQSWGFTDLADLKLMGTKPVELSTTIGIAPALPEAVTPLYAKGEGLPVTVQWQPVDPAVWNKRGTVTLTGSGTDVYGQAFTDATATVTVGKYTATDPVSATVGVGASLSDVQATAPTTVPGQVGTSTARNDLAVTWDWSAVDPAALQAPGTVTVPGKANTGVEKEKLLDATLTLVVVDRVASSNICRDDSATTVTASYTEGSYVARNTCDGNASTRWSNWVSGGRAGDTLSYGFGRDYTVDSVTVTLAERAAQSLKVQYQDAAGAWQDTSAGTVTGLTTTAPAKVTFTPVTTRGIRVVLTTPGSYTKVAEVAINGSRLADANVADLGRLLVDQRSVNGFTGDVASYTVLTASAALPTVAAHPVDTNAKVSIVQATAEQPSSTVTVTAPDGTVRSYTVAFVTGKAACANGGWANSIEPGFGNEGECVSFFSSK